MTWFERVPIRLVRVYMDQLSQLEAEESFRDMERIGMGTGSFEKNDARAVTSRWRKAARIDQRVKPSRATVTDLSAMGIKYVEATGGV